MAHLPIFMDLKDRTCVVIGGGPIAERKVDALRRAGATIVVISPTVTSTLDGYAQTGVIIHRRRVYQPGDLDGVALAFEATGDLAAARMVADEAQTAGIPINVADTPDLCTFIMPAMMRRGALQIAIATGGASPALARSIREQLEDQYGPEYELMIDLIAAARGWLKANVANIDERTQKLTALARSALCYALRQGNLAAVECTIRDVIGAGLAEIGYDRARCVGALRELGIDVPDTSASA